MRGAPFDSTAGGFGAGVDFGAGAFDFVELVEGFAELPVDAPGFALEVVGLLAAAVFEEVAADFELSEVAELAGAIPTAEAIRR